MDWDWKPSVSTPLFRRLFGNEGLREERETEDIYARIGSVEPYTARDIISRVYHYFSLVPDDLLNPMRDALEALVLQERYMFAIPRPPPTTLAEFTEFRNLLRHKQYFLDNRVQLDQLLHE